MQVARAGASECEMVPPKYSPPLPHYTSAIIIHIHPPPPCHPSSASLSSPPPLPVQAPWLVSPKGMRGA
eukprot:scaffold74539_cov65-Cyclotella_meneghiniana.AAC.1